MDADSWDDRGTGQPPKPRSYPMSYPRDHRPKWNMFPQTLDDLLKRAGPYADATRIRVEWGAITLWMMKMGADKALEGAGISYAVANHCVFITRQAKEREAGWPNATGIIPHLALYDHSPECQCEARRVADDVYALWEAAGRPHLNADRCKTEFQHLVACIRNGVIPQQKTIGDVPPHDTQ